MWHHVSRAHNFPLTMGLHVYKEHSTLVQMRFSTSIYKSSKFIILFFLKLNRNIVLWKETVMQLLSNVMRGNRPWAQFGFLDHVALTACFISYEKWMQRDTCPHHTLFTLKVFWTQSFLDSYPDVKPPRQHDITQSHLPCFVGPCMT